MAKGAKDSNIRKLWLGITQTQCRTCPKYAKHGKGMFWSSV